MQKISAGKFHLNPPSQVTSFDHLVGEREQLVRHVEAERLGGLHVDGQLVLRRRLYRQGGWFLALEDAIDIRRWTPDNVDGGWPIGYQRALADELPDAIHRGKPMPLCQCHNQAAVGVDEWVR